jgi:hypothetical protein
MIGGQILSNCHFIILYNEQVYSNEYTKVQNSRHNVSSFVPVYVHMYIHTLLEDLVENVCLL